MELAVRIRSNESAVSGQLLKLELTIASNPLTALLDIARYNGLGG